MGLASPTVGVISTTVIQVTLIVGVVPPTVGLPLIIKGDPFAGIIRSPTVGGTNPTIRQVYPTVNVVPPTVGVASPTVG